MADDTHPIRQQKIQIQQSTFMGCAWFGAWLFTVGYLQLGFWRGALALPLWPYYLGVHFSHLMR